MSESRTYTDFDAWFSEQEGFSSRAERFDGDVEWLRAAFEAGRSASPTPPEGGEPVAWHWWASDKSSTWPVWSLGPERPSNAPGAIPLYAHPSPDTGALREALRGVRRLRGMDATKIPEEVYEKAMAAWHGTPKADREQHGARLVIANAIMAERDRIQQIISAEREWGDFLPNDISERLWSGDGPRLISGWNARMSEDDDDVLIPEDGVYVKPAEGG